MKLFTRLCLLVALLIFQSGGSVAVYPECSVDTDCRQGEICPCQNSSGNCLGTCCKADQTPCLRLGKFGFTGLCCDKGKDCSNGVCCEPGLKGCVNKCCDKGKDCSNGVCCEPDLKGCGSICCANGK